MTIVRSISPEAKAIYKMRRENLKLLSRTLQFQMKSGAADFDISRRCQVLLRRTLTGQHPFNPDSVRQLPDL